MLVFPQQALDLFPQSDTPVAQRWIQGFIIVDPDHYNCTKGVHVCNKINRSFDIVKTFTFCSQNKGVAVGNLRGQAYFVQPANMIDSKPFAESF